MIKILGLKRVIVLVVLIAVNGVLGGLAYLVLQPNIDGMNKKHQVLKGEISKLQNDITQLQTEFVQIGESKERYKVLQDEGFFNDQNRRNAELKLEEIQARSRLISAVVSIGSGKLEVTPETKAVNYGLLNSLISVKVEAVNDLDVFHYIDLIENSLPGYVSLSELSLDRKADLTSASLRALSSDKQPFLVEANLKFSWRTMIPVESVQ